ncbi:MAG: NAD(P)/FAD-dependent oxidoreductase [Chloroflexi bacterium]|nr:NAD(P)/FAD-dependent oxidoreductase [Chloroflexota bacterium]
MYDAIVVGARCAGSPTAMLLARKGYSVLLVDKMSFPSDIMSTHYIHVPGALRLQRWGLLDKVLATNSPPIMQIKLHVNGIEFSPPRPEGPEGEPPVPAVCPRRTVLDKILVDAAVEAGAELRERFSVRELVLDGERVVGLRGAERGGAEVTEEARIVIGADGMHSTVAKAVHAPEYKTAPTQSFAYYTYWSGVSLECAELYFLETGGVLAFPTNDDLACVAIGGQTEDFLEFRKDIKGNYFKVLDQTPSLVERMRGAKQVERFIGTNDQPNFFRRPYGPGWALVGDAGYHRDFVTGLGITDAFRDAELLAQAIDDGFSGRRPIEEALASYESARNKIAEPLYEVTLQLISGEQPQMETWLAFGAALQAMMEQEPAVAGAS